MAPLVSFRVAYFDSFVGSRVGPVRIHLRRSGRIHGMSEGSLALFIESLNNNNAREGRRIQVGGESREEGTE